jgi:hypothetical protein
MVTLLYGSQYGKNRKLRIYIEGIRRGNIGAQ